MRTYRKTHPWLTFSLDLGQLTPQTWLLLGQAQAKCEQISGIPLLPVIAAELHRVYLAKGVHATTAIEGNSLTEEQVRQRSEKGLKLPPSLEYQGQEVDNIVAACNAIGQSVLDGRIEGIRVGEILDCHARILSGLPGDANPGKLREAGHDVRVGRYRGAPPEDLGYLLEALCSWLNGAFAATNSELRFVYGILKAIVAHAYLAWIHPFGDGNGRTARLLEFRILLEAGVPTPAAHLLSNHFNRTRSEYYRYLDLSSRQEDGLYAFTRYALQGFVDGLNEQIGQIEVQQLHVHWTHFIHDRFRTEQDTPASARRRRLALDLSDRDAAVPFSRIRMVSAQVAESYANRTDHTIRRDLHRLGKMGLIRAETDGYIANREIMKAFTPVRRDGQEATD